MSKLKTLFVLILISGLSASADQECQKLKASAGPRGSCLNNFLKEHPDFSCNYVAQAICQPDPKNLNDEVIREPANSSQKNKPSQMSQLKNSF